MWQWATKVTLGTGEGGGPVLFLSIPIIQLLVYLIHERSYNTGRDFIRSRHSPFPSVSFKPCKERSPARCLLHMLSYSVLQETRDGPDTYLQSFLIEARDGPQTYLQSFLIEASLLLLVHQPVVKFFEADHGDRKQFSWVRVVQLGLLPDQRVYTWIYFDR